MYNFKFLLLAIMICGSFYAQDIKNDSIKKEMTVEESDTAITKSVLLQEVVIHRQKLTTEEKKQFLLLQNRVYKVYPYAKAAAERLTILNKNMANLQTNKEKRKYFKVVEHYLQNEFSDRLKNLSRKQGQVLVKLIHRQTGYTTYDLIKEQKSGWKAFWSNTTARLFDINLKTPYAPFDVNEDFLIETILYRAFNRGILIPQEPHTAIDYDQLSDFWYAKAASKSKK